ncbi:MAG TPA: hypothetical protein VNV17_02245 [Solirubrobacteraceae bacterium]|jgi:hypothetical protein|nr:hypothetical protein [Solirubrobacteraceae bacterium]
MDDERDRTDQPLPGSVSDQNAEEAEPGHGGGEHARRKGTGGDPDSGGGDQESGGEAGEGSQSTGHPDSAG